MKMYVNYLLILVGCPRKTPRAPNLRRPLLKFGSSRRLVGDGPSDSYKGNSCKSLPLNLVSVSLTERHLLHVCTKKSAKLIIVLHKSCEESCDRKNNGSF